MFSPSLEELTVLKCFYHRHFLVLYSLCADRDLGLFNVRVAKFEIQASQKRGTGIENTSFFACLSPVCDPRFNPAALGPGAIAKAALRFQVRIFCRSGTKQEFAILAWRWRVEEAVTRQT
jgi:hypothetical protein